MSLVSRRRCHTACCVEVHLIEAKKFINKTEAEKELVKWSSGANLNTPRSIERLQNLDTPVYLALIKNQYIDSYSFITWGACSGESKKEFSEIGELDN
ncbi:MAG TPA: hypothetical protein VJA86_02240 [Candidatus Nanoarchaeia archaeon]|nr:hypothetical protein [Candidatus Nanoarchaeia archaeon]